MRKINTHFSLFMISLMILLSTSLTVKAQAEDDFEVTVSADLVSNYIWRGQDLGGVSVQPTFGIGYKGLSLSAWGSIGFDQIDPKEIDLTLSYEIKGLCLGITDYWVSGSDKYFHYASHTTGHVFEGNIGYDFGILALNWYTNFAGYDYYKSNGNRAYSSYFEISAPFKFASLDWSAEVGATPWDGSYAPGCAVVKVSLGATKTFDINEKFSLPIFAKLKANQSTESFYFAFGLTF